VKLNESQNILDVLLLMNFSKANKSYCGFSRGQFQVERFQQWS